MNLQIVSYNGTNLNNELFKAYFPVPSVMLGPDVDIGEVERSYFHPISTYKKRKSKMLFIHIIMTASTIASDIDTLNKLFNPYDDDFHDLVCEDQNDNNKRYYVSGTPAGHPDWDGQEVTVSLKVDDPVWKTENDVDTTWSITGDGDQETIAIGGNFYSEPTFEITPTTAKTGGKAYRIFCPVYNQMSIDLDNYPVDICNNDLDTSALVADATTYVIINDGDGISDADTTIDVDGETGSFPTSGIAYLGTEQISYTAYASDQLTGCTRGINGTSAAAHADDVVIYASRMDADGGDIGITVDGIQVDFWLQDINTATSQIWINLDLSSTLDTTLGTAIADSGSITTITIENTAGNITNLYNMPDNGRVLIGSELFSYTGKNMDTRQLTGVIRQAYGTSAAAHSVSDAIHWIEYEIYIYHGNHNLPSFSVNNDNQPYIELDSTNTSWEWDAVFAKTDTLKEYVLKTDGWRGIFPDRWNETSDPYYNQYMRHPSVSYGYGYYESMDTSAPSTQTDEASLTFSVLGVYMLNTALSSLFQWSSTYGSWPFVHYSPTGFTHIAATGLRYLSAAAGADWFRVDAGYYMFRTSASSDPEDVTYNDPGDDAFSVAAPAGTGASDPWSQVAVDLGGTNYFAIFYPLRASTDRDEECRIEVDTVTLTLDSNNTPVASAGDSVEIYSIDAELVNTTTGEYISINYNINLGSTLTIYTANKTVIDSDSGASERGAISFSSYRFDWLKLPPGSNVLEWDEDNAAGVTVVVTRKDRKL